MTSSTHFHLSSAQQFAQSLVELYNKKEVKKELDIYMDRTSGLSFPDWCLKSIIDGHQFTFDRREYLIEPYNDDHPWQVTQKATQLGETIRAMLRAVYGMLVKGQRSVLYYFPTDTDVTRFSKGRAKPFITENPHISKHINKTDEVHLKQFGNCLWYLLGMGTALSVKSIPGNAIYLDEFDEANQDAFEMVLERLGGQMDEDEISVHLFSNPTLPDFGVSREFEFTDQKYFMLVCPSCGHYNCLEDMFMDWINEDIHADPPLIALPTGETIRVCGKCQGKLDPAKGEWVKKKPSITDKRGYHYTQLWSQTQWHSPENILSKYYNALAKGNLQTFINQTIGFGYVEAENRLSAEEVLELCGTKGIVSSDDGPCFMGVDQNKGIHVVIGKKCEGKAGKIVHLEVYKDFEELDSLMQNFHVSRCVIDALPETRNARTFAERFPGRVYMNYYNVHQKGDYAWNEREYIVKCNRTESLDASHAEIRLGNIILPKRCDITKTFADHLHNVAKKLVEEEEIDPITRLKRKTGSKRYTYVKLGEDHFRHAYNYECMARQSGSNLLFPGWA